MPSDTYILTISEAGVSVPSSHASTHLTGGSDPIQTANATSSGLMSAAIYNQHVTNTAKISNVTHTGDVTDAAGVLTVNKINGVSMAGLATGIVKNTTGTGAPSIAVAADFPTLNQNTTGTAASAGNLTGGSAGSIPYQSLANTTAMLSAGTAGYVLQSNGSAAPSWAPVTLSGNLSGTLPVANGGTGQTVYAVGDLLYANTSSSLARLPDVATGSVLLSGGIGTAPSYGKVGLSTHTTGTLPVANGGTGTTTSTGNGSVVLSNAATISNPILTSPALGTPSSGNLSSCTDLPIGNGTTGTLSVARGGTGVTTSTGNGSVVLSNQASLSSPTLTTPVLGTPISGNLTNCTGLSLSTGVSGLLSIANGGTGGNTSTGTGNLVFSDNPVFVEPQLGTPDSGNLSNCTDLPIGSGTTGTLSVARGGTGVTTSTGNGSVVFSTSPTLTNPVLVGPQLGTPSSGNLSSCVSLPLSTGVTGVLPVARGGTGSSDLTGIIVGDGENPFTAITAPTGDLVGTSDTQTLTNKTLGNGTVISVLGTPSSGNLTNCTSLPIGNGTTGVLAVNRGGTGLASYTSGDIIYANTTSSLSTISSAVTGNALISGGIGSAPSFGKIGLTTHVTGILPVANGGTGKSTYASSGPLYYSASTGTIDVGENGTVTVSNGGTGRSSFENTYSLITSGNSSTGSLSVLSVGTSGQILRSNGSGAAPTWTDFSASNISSGTLPVARGGTGQTSFSAGVLTANGTNSFSTVTAPTGTIVGTSDTQSLTNKTFSTNCTYNGNTISLNYGGTGFTNTSNAVKYISGNVTISVGSIGTYTTLSNDGTMSDSTNMSSGSANTFSLKNTSGFSRRYFVQATVTASCGAAGNQTIGLALGSGVTGSVNVNSVTQSRASTTDTASVVDLTSSYLLDIPSNYEAAVFVANHTSTNNITVQKAQLLAFAIL